MTTTTYTHPDLDPPNDLEPARRAAHLVDTPGSVWDLVGPTYDSSEAAHQAAHRLEAVFEGYRAEVRYSHRLRGWVCDGIRD